MRHAELGYTVLSTGLEDVRLPAGIPFREWDTWHSQIVNDELCRVVSPPSLAGGRRGCSCGNRDILV
jgi:hypothetical protein